MGSIGNIAKTGSPNFQLDTTLDIWKYGTIKPIEQVGQETKRTGNNIMEFFKGPGPVKPPPPPDPQPIPQADQSKAGEEQAKRLRLRRGRSKTIVTGGLTPIPTRKTVLG